MTDAVEVAIVGAGPYGLSLAAHLRAAGVPCRQFGQPMRLWRDSMPLGMQLKSPGFASSLSSPDGRHTLAEYCAETGRAYEDYGAPVPLDTFVGYGLEFARRTGADVEQVLVTGLSQAGDKYQLDLADGQRVSARRVVVATGVEHFARIPDQLSGLPQTAVTHSSAHPDLAVFSGKSVIVLGAGQSALECAALAHEAGASVTLVARRPKIAWNGPLLPVDRSLAWRIREPVTGLGSGWGHWFYARQPRVFRHLPAKTRVYRAAVTLGPSGAAWLADRVNDQFPVLTGQALTAAKADDDGVRLSFDGADGTHAELTADHVIAATGYRADLRRLAFLEAGLRDCLRSVAGTPAVDRHFQSSAPGLYFIGPAVAASFGPLMRFVCGAEFAAATAAGHLAKQVRPGRPAR